MSCTYNFVGLIIANWMFVLFGFILCYYYFWSEYRDVIAAYRKQKEIVDAEVKDLNKAGALFLIKHDDRGFPMIHKYRDDEWAEYDREKYVLHGPPIF